MVIAWPGPRASTSPSAASRSSATGRRRRSWTTPPAPRVPPRRASRNGRHLYLLVADGHSPASTGLTLAGLAALLRQVGAENAMDLDGGGSTTLVLRGPGEPVASVRNFPPGGVERAVANGIGVFVRP